MMIYDLCYVIVDSNGRFWFLTYKSFAVCDVLSGGRGGKSQHRLHADFQM